MSLSIFNAVGSIEVANDAPHFKRVDLGRFLGIVDVKATYRDTSTVSRKLLSNGVGLPHSLLQSQNDHDFVAMLLLFRATT